MSEKFKKYIKTWNLGNRVSDKKEAIRLNSREF